MEWEFQRFVSHELDKDSVGDFARLAIEQAKGVMGMIGKFEIIRAQIQDSQLLSELGARLFEETFRGTCTDDDMSWQLEEYYNPRQVAKELADEQDFFFLLKIEDQVQGYSRMKEGSPPYEVLQGKRAIELKRLYLERGCHGKGFAAVLLQHNLELARVLNYQRVYLSVWEHNERAKAFYSKSGFKYSGVDNPFPIGQTPQTDCWYVMDLG